MLYVNKQTSNRNLIARLQARFALSGDPDDKQLPVTLAQQIVPVTDADKLISVPLFYVAHVSVTATGQKPILQVPSGKRWKLWVLSAQKKSGTLTFGQLYANNGTDYIYLKTYTSSQTMVAEPMYGVALDQSWWLGCEVDSYSVTGDLYLSTIVEEEDAY